MKQILLVIDYQHDFVDGSLGFAGAEELDERIAAYIERFRARGDEVIFTLDTHSKGYERTREGRFLPTVHCMRQSDGWRLYGKTAQAMRPQDLCFEKSSYGSPELFDYLRGARADRIVLVGLVSNICVLANAVLAMTAQPEAEIAVYTDAISSFDPKLHEQTLDVMRGINITLLPPDAV